MNQIRNDWIRSTHGIINGGSYLVVSCRSSLLVFVVVNIHFVAEGSTFFSRWKHAREPVISRIPSFLRLSSSFVGVIAQRRWSIEFFFFFFSIHASVDFSSKRIFSKIEDPSNAWKRLDRTISADSPWPNFAIPFTNRSVLVLIRAYYRRVELSFG